MEVAAPPCPPHVRRLASVVVPAAVAAGGGRDDPDGGGRRRQGQPRTRGRLQAPLPAVVVRPELPPDLAGRCFNCLSEHHVAAVCPNPTKCLRCSSEGHVARLCRSRRSPSGSSSSAGQPVQAARRGQGPPQRGPAPAPRVVLAPAPGARPRPGPAILARLGPVPAPAPAPAPTLAPAPVPLLPLGAASRRPGAECCFIPRGVEMEAEERALQWSTVVSVTGVRSRIALAAVERVILACFPELEGCFSAHRFWPDDFLVVFNSREARDAVMAVGSIEGRGFSLRFSLWNRFRQAVGHTISFRVHLEVEGVPPHAWSSSTAASLLGTSCVVEWLGTSTTNKEDLGRFTIYAWTPDPSLIPREKVLMNPEAPVPLEGEEDDDLLVPQEMMIPTEVHLLEYRAIIHLLRVEDTVVSTDRSSSDDWPSNDGDSGHNGDPPHGYGDRRPARGNMQNIFNCSRGQVDADDAGGHPSGFRRVDRGERLAGARLSVAAAEFRPAERVLSLSLDPVVEWMRGPLWCAKEVWDPMWLEASPSLSGSGSMAPPDLSPSDLVVYPEDVSSMAHSPAPTMEQALLSTFVVSVSGGVSPAPASPVAASEGGPGGASPRLARSPASPGEDLAAPASRGVETFCARHVTAILSLFGWESTALPLEEGAEVEVLG
ncbi:hypothetical protein BRADI_3g28775v3 [Brachypodium distachyon]|uniref:CCHC-type domain-containing protein n=1 Tax=Brachypodium distachyon TaxID=15368 RepID=A0A0Q3FCY8_BRADI|nr:hypothetical protein BRADI_3g28775v3 [Brachypodium distachyon]